MSFFMRLSAPKAPLASRVSNQSRASSISNKKILDKTDDLGKPVKGGSNSAPPPPPPAPQKPTKSEELEPTMYEEDFDNYLKELEKKTQKLRPRITELNYVADPSKQGSS